MKKSKDKRNNKKQSPQTLYKLYMRVRMMATCSMEGINYVRPALAMKDIMALTHDDDGNSASLEQIATVFMAVHTPYTSKLTTFDEFLADLAVTTTYTPPDVVEAVNAAVDAITKTEADASKAVTVSTPDESETEEDEDSEEDSDDTLSESEESEDEDNEESDEEDEEEDAEKEKTVEVAPTPPSKLEIPPDVRKKKKKKKNKKHKKNG